MVTYKNILYCTDFSESAKAALPFAIDMTKKYGATLHIIHVYQDPSHKTHPISLSLKSLPISRWIGSEWLTPWERRRKKS
jgi:nucleotide-binding universal stress UspA family protein